VADKDTVSRQEEARNLVEEAKQAEQSGDTEEAQFLREAAKDMDPAVVKSEGGASK
jgi:hypothetical protein